MFILKGEVSFNEKLVTDCLKSNHVPKVIILHQLTGAEMHFFFSIGTQPAEAELRAGESSDLHKLKSQSKCGYNHGSLIIHYYSKSLISLCLSFAMYAFDAPNNYVIFKM